MTTATVLETIGKAKLHAPAYSASDWIERDNFETIEQARGYATYLSRQHSATPYRIVASADRFVVEFVPEWKLR